MTKLSVDSYVIDVLMRDLIGHDRMPSAFVLYLWLWRQSRARRRSTVGASLQTIASETGLSKSSVQNAVRWLAGRGLVRAQKSGPTDPPVYEVLQPWIR
jgi:replication initiation and membrane attachment protein DnaB